MNMQASQISTNTVSGQAQGGYLLYIGIAFTALLMISNTVAVKLVEIGPFILSGATLLFPITYIFGDILTEVYGYRATRRIIWAGFGALALMSAGYLVVQYLPAAAFWKGQEAYESILGFAPRIALASMIAFLAGEFCNSFVLSRMKVRMEGRRLWMRTIGSTVAGEGVDTIIFIAIAFGGTMPPAALITLMGSVYLFKVLVEAIATPATYAAVSALKRAERMDVYDTDVNYNPFQLK